MYSIRNSIQLIGHLGKDVEFKKFNSGKTKSSFSLATNDYYKNSEGEKVEETQWHNVVAWGKTSELMQTMLKKGSEVLIKGKLVNRSYEDNEGNKKYISEVVASDFVLFGKKNDAPF